MNKKIIFLFALSLILFFQSYIHTQQLYPILEIPDKDLDDSIVYKNYLTRFYKDIDGNTVQIILNSNNGRIVNLLADGANESISFTIRSSNETSVQFDWNNSEVTAYHQNGFRYFDYTFKCKSNSIEIGHFIIGSMRKERDFQYQQLHLLPFDSTNLFIEPEFVTMIDNISKLSTNEKISHLSLLNANTTDDLKNRLIPKIEVTDSLNKYFVKVTQEYFDGKNQLGINFIFDKNGVDIKFQNQKISINSIKDESLILKIILKTNSHSLQSISEKQILNKNFYLFYERVKSTQDLTKIKRFEREIKGLELLTFEDKMMAGLPNFATYFGRDMLMTAMMMQPIINPSIIENVIISVLKKLHEIGEVSHEEALLGQAIKENAQKYNYIMNHYFNSNNQDTAKLLLIQAKEILKNLNKTTENYNMVDDDFQLPYLFSLYLSDKNIPLQQKEDFLKLQIEKDSDTLSVLELILQNYKFITEISYNYVKNTEANNLISFKYKDGKDWLPGSWRDSRAGYAGGRFAMDVNVVWVPKALEGLKAFFNILNELGYNKNHLLKINPNLNNSVLLKYYANQNELETAINIWKNAIQYFYVKLSATEINEKIDKRLNWLKDEEKNYWRKIFENNKNNLNTINFLALSLDENGKPIPAPNTDIGMLLFTNDYTSLILRNEIPTDSILSLLEILIKPYPIGLLINNIGSVCVNDIYTSQKIWENFYNDRYHSPFVVWGREVNLILLGLSKQILSAYDNNGKLINEKLLIWVEKLKEILKTIKTTVDNSNLQHNELWSYEIKDETLYPKRYSTSSDIQLWNLTDLSAQFYLENVNQLK